MILAPEGRNKGVRRLCFAPSGLEVLMGAAHQGLTPLAINCRPSGAKDNLNLMSTGSDSLKPPATNNCHPQKNAYHHNGGDVFG
jgi:hypothetical protein